MLIKATSVVLLGTAALLMEVPFISSESASLLIWGGTLLALSSSLRFVTARGVAGHALNIRLGRPQPKGMLSLVTNVPGARQ